MQKNLLNKRLVIDFIVSISIFITLYLVSKKPEHDVRMYVFIDQQIKLASNFGNIGELKLMHAKQDIDGQVFEGDIYITKDKSMVIVLNHPEISVWLISNLSGGPCYKLSGEGNLRGFLYDSRKICQSD